MIQLDEIGVIYAATPADAPEDFQPEALPGWHVNATAPVPGWDAQRVTPATPRRTFGSLPTVFYTFSDKAEFDTALEVADLTEPPPVPQTVTMRQARLALLAAEKLANVSVAINALPSPQKEAAQIEYEYSQEVQRNNGFVSLLAPALGMTDADLDELFINAATL